ncbi:class I SAM-dependent methyltransferase [Thermogemmatispora sp.]|uniref:class I SAM-dependent methyltransferase n=1 Tax=Thermogemmatispora sp. TaxID=1968838 RepID=UPI001DA89657|nr:class I SAM-dependent methyltransferase [Thermogemmatispora sp.]MBX5449560.1 class I SAM-dependent methyltransferase [Thermogemmatispora sp.]
MDHTEEKLLYSIPEPEELQHLYHAQHGLFPPEIEVKHLRRILHLSYADLAWAPAVVRAYPALSVVALFASARALAACWQRLDETVLRRLSIAEIDLAESLPFAGNFFDLVHLFLRGPLLRPALWPALLRECRRVLLLRGQINIVAFLAGPSSSAAYQRLRSLAMAAWQALGYGFGTATTGNSSLFIDGALHLCQLLQEQGFGQVGYRLYPVDLGGWNNPAGRACCRRFLHDLVQQKALILAQGGCDEITFAKLLAEAERDLGAEAFCASGALLSVTARKR